MRTRLRFVDALRVLRLEWFHTLRNAVRLALVFTAPRDGSTVHMIPFVVIFRVGYDFFAWRLPF